MKLVKDQRKKNKIASVELSHGARPAEVLLLSAIALESYRGPDGPLFYREASQIGPHSLESYIEMKSPSNSQIHLETQT